MSLSARRAWIEIKKIGRLLVAVRVALRKESVDRNSSGAKADSVSKWSLSARRAWIEIGLFGTDSVSYQSLSARRAWIEMQCPD